MVNINEEIIEIANKPGRIGVLATASRDGDPNVAYFGSPQLRSDGTLVMGLGDNRTLKNLEENPKAVFFVITESPVSFQTPGYRLYLEAETIEKEGAIVDGVREKIAQHAGEQAAQMIQAGAVFSITEMRKLIDMG